MPRTRIKERRNQNKKIVRNVKKKTTLSTLVMECCNPIEIPCKDLTKMTHSRLIKRKKIDIYAPSVD